MNLPRRDSQSLISIKKIREFIQASVVLFHKYEWVYQFKMTEILFPRNIEKLSTEFVDFFKSSELEDIKIFQNARQIREVQKLTNIWPQSITEFKRACTELELEELCVKFKVSTPCAIPKKWSRKKFEEVAYLSDFIKQSTSLNGCDAIVDIGSGLGYLSSYLAETCGIPVIAVESKREMVESVAAVATESNVIVEFVNLELNSGIAVQLSPYLSKYTSICITGLHACGNLTPWSLKLFLEDPKYSLLAIVPCCYHKMNLDFFQNIPLSKVLSDELVSLYGQSNFILVRNEAFCRIATQRNSNMFAVDLENETKHVFYRGLVELYAKQADIETQKNRRKGPKGNLGTFEEYIVKTFGPNGKFTIAGKFASHKDNMLELFNQKRELSKVVSGIIVMQGDLQVIAENLILLDRVAFLLESGKVDACLKRVIPESVSPRGFLLSARKLDGV